MVAACSLGVDGVGSDGALPVAGPQVTGSLRSTPRGSNSTMSKSSSSCGVSESSSLVMSSMPDTPGPPGSMTSDPMRAAGSSAGWRATAMGMVGPRDARSPSGTTSVPHWRSPLQADQTIGVTGAWVVDVVVWRGAGGRAEGDALVGAAAATKAARQHDEERQSQPRRHPAQRCTCLSGEGHRSPAVHAEEWIGGPGRRVGSGAGASARAAYERRRRQGRRPPAGGVRPARPAGPRSSPARGGPPRPGVAAPTARSAWGTGSTVSSAGAASCCTTGPSPIGAANLDHLVVVPSGVWVVDTKHYRGTLGAPGVRGVVRRPSPPRGGRTRPEPAWWLRPAGSRLWWPRCSAPGRPSAPRCASPVSSAGSSPGPSSSTACSSPGPGLSPGPWPPRTPRPTRRGVLADRLCPGLPALRALTHAPGGTSHRPTGASPSG